MIRTISTTAALLTLACSVHANNIQISNSTLVDDAPADGFCKVRFDISWENSWRVSTAPNNWDAAWVFVKYRDINTGLWHHARLGGDANHSAPTGSTISTGLLTPGSPFNVNTNWGVGVFIHRSANGTGTFNATGVELRWNYGANGINYGTIDEVKVFGVEMVNVRPGPFYVGTSSNGVNSFITSGSETIPYHVTSEDEISLGPETGDLWMRGDANAQALHIGYYGPLPAPYPKGTQEFYIMKHELSTTQFMNFLNTLSRAQQNTMTGAELGPGISNRPYHTVLLSQSGNAERHPISCPISFHPDAPIIFHMDGNANDIPNEPNDGSYKAFATPHVANISSYLDWSGLRPMTELEYEKACRGSNHPSTYYYPWGDASILSPNTHIYQLTNANEIDEYCSNPFNVVNVNSLNWNWGGLGSNNKVNRTGAFATATTNMPQSGASYYGALDMAGNVWEVVISVHTDSRYYTGLHGDGSISASGLANEPHWSLDMIRGSSALTGPEIFFIDTRLRTTNMQYTHSLKGVRGVRRAP